MIAGSIGTGDGLPVTALDQSPSPQRKGGDVTLRTLGPGARTATVRSRSSVNLLPVDRDAFHALFTNLPPLRGFFEQLIGMRSQ